MTELIYKYFENKIRLLKMKSRRNVFQILIEEEIVNVTHSITIFPCSTNYIRVLHIEKIIHLMTFNHYNNTKNKHLERKNK